MVDAVFVIYPPTLFHRRSQPTLIFSPMSTVFVVAPNRGRPASAIVRRMERSPLILLPSVSFFLPPLSTFLSLSLSSCIISRMTTMLRWWYLAFLLFFLAVLIIRGTLTQLTDNKQWQEVVHAIAFLFFFSAFRPPPPPFHITSPTQELSSFLFFLLNLPFSFIFLSNTKLTTNFFFEMGVKKLKIIQRYPDSFMDLSPTHG